MKFATVSSGIEAPCVAWHPLGWTPVWFSEIAEFPSRILKHYYPTVPNLGDMLKLHENQFFHDSDFDLLAGGTPCQSFSLAGLRGGLSDDRGNLALEFCRILITKRPRWFVWENVPGVLSSYSNAGKDDAGDELTGGTSSDFAQILEAFRECGYSCAWRVLDAQYFGVAQCRRRVFVIGYFGNDWRPPATVLLEPNSLPRNIKAGRKSKKSVTPVIDGSPDQSGEKITARTLTTGGTKQRFHDDYVILESGQANATISTTNCPTLTCLHESPIITGTLSAGAHPGGFNGQDLTSRLYHIETTNEGPFIRRLTPLEWERLQGFPDNYTKIEGASDSARYRALGNSMAVPVMHWIGRRIQQVDDILKSKNK